MTPEELLKTLKDGGMDDDAIKKLLGDTLAMFDQSSVEEEEKVTEEDERKQAGELLGVTL